MRCRRGEGEAGAERGESGFQEREERHTHVCVRVPLPGATEIYTRYPP